MASITFKLVNEDCPQKSKDGEIEVNGCRALSGCVIVGAISRERSQVSPLSVLNTL